MANGLRDIGAESILVAGGARAILLQLAHPAVGRGVAEHSDFATRPLDRLNGTLAYVYAVTYGTDAEVAYVRRLVNRAHAPVRGEAGADGPAYSAFDPALQLWVAATLYDTAVTVHELVFGPLDAATSDAVYREYAVIGTSLQMSPDAWPADRTLFRRYWDRTMSELEVSDAVRDVAWQLLHPRTGPVWMRAAMPTARLVTAGMLPDPLRTEFGLRWDERSARRFRRLSATTRFAYPLLPRRLRHRLRDHYLGLVRRRMSAEQQSRELSTARQRTRSPQIDR